MQLYNNIVSIIKNRHCLNKIKFVHARFRLWSVMQNPVTPQYTLMLIFPLHCFLSVESGCSGEGGVRGQQYPEENVHKAVVMNIHL